MHTIDQLCHLSYIKSIQTINKEMSDIQISILSFINDMTTIDSINELLEKYNTLNDENKFNDFLQLINKITSSLFKQIEYNKINEIINFIKPKVIEKYSKTEIFLNFKGNFPVLLFLLENHIIDFDPFLKYPQYDLYRFFLPEYIEHGKIKQLKSFFDKEIEQYSNDLEQFKSKRKEFHSDLLIAKIIREDDIESFTDYISHNNMPLDYKIPEPLYEINSDLRFMCNTLIEYSAVFRSIQIFKYLYNQIKELPNNIFLAAVLGGSSEIIHLIENKGIKPGNFELFRSICAHQVDLFDYFVSNYSLEIEYDLVNDSIRAFNYFIFNEILIRKPEFLTSFGCINSMFAQAASSDNRLLFNVLYEIPELDVNAQQEIFTFLLMKFHFFFLNGNTSLHFASCSNNLYIVKKLLKHPKIDVNIGDAVFEYTFIGL